MNTRVPFDEDYVRLVGTVGVTSRNAERIVRQEPSEWPLVANNGPFLRIILLCPVEAYLGLTSGTVR